MQPKIPDYREILKRELTRRKQRNATYSLRAFSRDLDIPAPRLSLILNQKQGLSVDAAKAIAQRLNWSLTEQSFFCDLVAASDSRSKKDREIASQRIIEEQKRLHSLSFIEDSLFTLISDWYHLALIELSLTRNFKYDHTWISKRLGISEDESKLACQRLVEAGLATITANGKFKATHQSITTSDGLPSDAVREFHWQVLEQSRRAFQQKVTERTFSSLMVAVDTALLPEIFEKISTFRKELNQWVTNHPDNKKPNEVYCLGTQFFKLTNETQEN